MRSTVKLALAAALAAAIPAFGAPSACGNDPSTAGLKARIQNLNDQMDRIQWTSDRAEHRRLMDLHVKLMHEGLQEIRKRETTSACREELMYSMLNQVVEHQLAEHEDVGH